MPEPTSYFFDSGESEESSRHIEILIYCRHSWDRLYFLVTWWVSPHEMSCPSPLLPIYEMNMLMGKVGPLEGFVLFGLLKCISPNFAATRLFQNRYTFPQPTKCLNNLNISWLIFQILYQPAANVDFAIFSLYRKITFMWILKRKIH